MEKRVEVNVILSLLWIVIMCNMIFNDIFSIIVEMVDGGVLAVPGDVKIFMAIAAIMTNIPICMIFLSRVLPHKSNRIANICAATFTILYVIGGGSALPHYITIAAFECLIAVAIIVISVRWKAHAA